MSKKIRGDVRLSGSAPGSPRGRWSAGAAAMPPRLCGSSPSVLLLFMLDPGCRPWPPPPLSLLDA